MSAAVPNLQVVRIAERIPPLPGGKEIHVEELSRRQTQLGDRVRLYYRLGRPIKGVPSSQLCGPAWLAERQGSVWTVFFSLRVAARLLLTRMPDVVHLHGDYREALALGILCKVRRTRFVVTVHGGLNMRHRRLARTAFRFVDEFIVLGPTPAAQLKLLGVNRRKIHVMSSGINTSMLDSFADNGSEERAAARVVCVGTLDKVKNQIVLIEAFRHLSEFNEAELIILGEGPERGVLEQASNGLGRISFAGRKEREEVYAIVATSTIFVLPSVPTATKAEGVSTALLEAMYLGLPCVVARESDPGLRDPLGRAPYLTFPGESADELHRILAMLLRDASERSDLGVRAREVAASRSWDRVALEMRTILGGAR